MSTLGFLLIAAGLSAMYLVLSGKFPPQATPTDQGGSSGGSTGGDSSFGGGTSSGYEPPVSGHQTGGQQKAAGSGGVSVMALQQSFMASRGVRQL